MREYQPFTYLIRFKETGELYYGSKTAVGCHPDDLWTTYFTTSKVVKYLIESFGADWFEILHIKLHPTKEAALKWETMYLVSVDAARNPNYLNQHNGGDNFVCNGHTEETKKRISKTNSGENHPQFGIPKSAETKRKLSEAKSGENSHMWGVPLPEETKLKISEANKGKPKSEESKEKNRIAHLGENSWMFGKTGELCPNYGENNGMFGKVGKDNHSSKHYIVIHPDGHEEYIIGLSNFCNLYNLDVGNLHKSIKNPKSSHKGFRCRHAD